MKTNKRANITLFILVSLFLATSFLGCEKFVDTINIDCSECEFSEPDYGYLELTFSKHNLPSGIPFVVYEGKIEENKIVLMDTSFNTTHYIEGLGLKKYYSVKATYHSKDGMRYNVVDGSKIKSKYTTDACDDDCWVIVGKDINLTIKYDNLLE